MLCLILRSPSILQFAMMIEFSTSQLDNIELSPTLVFGPIVVFDSIKQFFPMIIGPLILEPVFMVRKRKVS